MRSVNLLTRRRKMIEALIKNFSSDKNLILVIFSNYSLMKIYHIKTICNSLKQLSYKDFKMHDIVFVTLYKFMTDLSHFYELSLTTLIRQIGLV
jgi:hypothetical protein